MDRQLWALVWQRAQATCEYCRLPQAFAEATHEVDHIISEKHAGATISENLALACFACNNHKGPNIAGLDPETTQITRLFHPRCDLWTEHFQWFGPTLTGRTAIGRTTVAVLAINLRHRVLLRQALMAEGVYPR